MENNTNNYIVNGREIEGESLEGLHVQLKGDLSTGHLLNIDGKSYQIKEAKLDLDQKILSCKIDSKYYEIEIITPFHQMIQGMGFSDVSAMEVNEVKAPMPGLVFDIMVAEGQEVTLDEPLMILEAMKMENIIKSPREGTIKKIKVNKTASVEKNAVLIEFE